MYSNSTKRKRASLAASPTKKPRVEPTYDPLWTQLTSLPASTRDFLLYEACKLHPSISLSLQKAQQDLLAAQAATRRRAPIADFDNISKECWHLLTNRYVKKSSSKVKLSVERVCKEVDAMRSEILERAGSGTRFETRRNAVEVLRKCCKSLVLCGDGAFAREMVGGEGLLDGFVGGLVGLVIAMEERERERFVEEGWWEKLSELGGTFVENGLEVGGIEVLSELFDGMGENEREEEREENAREEERKKEALRRVDSLKREHERIEILREREVVVLEEERREATRKSAKQMREKDKKKLPAPISIDSDDDDIRIVDSW